jgi:hypothetical protein
MTKMYLLSFVHNPSDTDAQIVYFRCALKTRGSFASRIWNDAAATSLDIRREAVARNETSVRVALGCLEWGWDSGARTGRRGHLWPGNPLTNGDLSPYPPFVLTKAEAGANPARSRRCIRSTSGMSLLGIESQTLFVEPFFVTAPLQRDA